MRTKTPFALAFVLVVASAAPAQVDPLGRSILFVRGADGSGGLGNGSQQQRTAHLSDIGDTSLGPGNTGFGELAQLLRGDGFAVTQWIESQGSLTLARLLPHRIVVFASNNRVYSAAEIQAFHSYFDAGGSALFISDANWGGNWDEAAASDNLFLARYGASVYQDSANGVIRLQRQTNGRYLQPAHPILAGPGGMGGGDDVSDFEGEGVSFFALGRGSGSLQPASLVSATGFMVRGTNGNGTPGPLAPAGPSDSAVWVVTQGDGVIAGHFDRNTFFNRNGAGTDLHQRDNTRFALQLFRFLASVPASWQSVGAACAAQGNPRLLVDGAELGRTQRFRLRDARPNTPAALLLAPGPAQGLALPGNCTLEPDPAQLLLLPMPVTDGQGHSALALPLPGALNLSGRLFTAQALIVGPGGPLLGALELSPGALLRLGWPR